MSDNTTTSSDVAMLTTSDNPWNPFTNFEDWLAFDESKGYGTLNYLARITRTSHDLSQPDQMIAINLAIDEIVAMNVLGLYVKVTAPTSTTTGSTND